MKKRLGFVSNSSSSSFMCVVCEEMESGMDATLEDVEMVACAQNHEFHTGCVKDEAKTALDAYLNTEPGEDDENGDDYYERRYNVSSDICPICSMKALLPAEEVAYLRKKLGVTQEAVLAEVVKKFSDYAAFMEAIK